MGCNELSSLTKLEVPSSQTITLPATPILLNEAIVRTPNVQIDSLLTVYNINSDLIQAISLKKMDLTLTAPAGGDLTYLKSLKIYIVADGLADVKIAGVDSVPDNTGSVLSLPVETVDLKDFMMKDKFQLKIVMSTDKTTAVEQQLKVDMKLMLDLKILGL
jgi:hypothetical protein